MIKESGIQLNIDHGTLARKCRENKTYKKIKL